MPEVTFFEGEVLGRLCKKKDKTLWWSALGAQEVKALNRMTKKGVVVRIDDRKGLRWVFNG